MAALCPYCQAELNIKRAGPGRYAARCAGCHKRLAILVPADENEPMKTVALRSELDAGRHEAETLVEQPASREGQPAGEQKTVVLGATGAPIQADEAAPGGAPIQADEAAPGGAPIQADEAAPGKGPTPEQDKTVLLGPEGARPAEAKTVVSPDEGPERPGRPPTAGAGELGAPRRLGGYELTKELGRGAMGIVFLARQISLDRDVALKLMSPRWASNPVFLARFSREAYAAAHLVHHNVVQIYDIGSDRDTYYFSMEFVPGEALSEMAEREGRLSPEVAAGYILQAARGLRFAHEQGMVHRDVKPANLMLNDQGIVKVADLGLVKTPESEGGGRAGDSTALKDGEAPAEVTQAGVTMGSPAFMAPEQAQDAASVDARADIYSLGCTFYALVTGRAPFEGATIREVLTKHATEPVAPPEAVVRGLSKRLSAIITRMLAKSPEDRYPDLRPVEKELEQFLGVDSAGPVKPREEEAFLLEGSVKAYNSSPTARLRTGLIWGFGLLCAVTAVLFAALGRPPVAGGILGLGVLSCVWYLLITGVTQKTHLFRRFRQLAFSNRPTDWVIWSVLAGLFIVLLWALGLLWMWLLFCVGALVITLGFHLVVDGIVNKQRRGPLGQVRYMLKRMRLRGLEELAVRQFVCECSGERWEPLYEAVFGYEAKMIARKHWGEGEDGQMRRKHAAWRDPLIEWMDRKLKARKEADDRRHLQAVEATALQAEGMSESQAMEQAQHAAEELVAQEVVVHEQTRGARRRAPQMTGQRARRTIAKKHTLDLLLGSRVRLVLGTVLLVAFALWMRQNNLIQGAKIKRAFIAERTRIRQAIAERDVSLVTGRRDEAGEEPEVPAGEPQETGEGAVEIAGETAAQELKPLKLPLLPESLAGALLNSFRPGLAGLVLLVSVFFMGWRMGLLVIPAAGMIMVGHVLGLPALGPIRSQYMGIVIAGALVAAALLFCREPELKAEAERGA